MTLRMRNWNLYQAVLLYAKKSAAVLALYWLQKEHMMNNSADGYKWGCHWCGTKDARRARCGAARLR
jgi:hypothetical protein